ncbi:hypothetical protein BDN71DRAFT_1510137 [Pleurotus eryngii]|uniref:Uncharacterized protein n=1 Tax=Pleurotus eryngii TaxID=5323 RepID=A0A9P5ZQA9_PLEER|nr:hypothetical protein BDN71DRAFT_1510137 [Pleurotus eryngii]
MQADCYPLQQRKIPCPDSPIATIEFLVQTLTWTVEIYTYGTDARPDQPQFEANGGSVVVVIQAWSICVSSQRPYVVAAQKQLPPSGSGVKNGDRWNYTAAYQEAMGVFNNGGNGALSFDAKYTEDFSRKDPLTGVTLRSGVEFIYPATTLRVSLSSVLTPWMPPRQSSPLKQIQLRS